MRNLKINQQEHNIAIGHPVMVERVDNILKELKDINSKLDRILENQ